MTPVAATVAVLVAVLAGCGPSGAGPFAPSARSVQTAPAPARPPGPDERACVGVEAVLGHVAAGTAAWSPQRRPFDRAISARLATWSTELAGAGSTARSSGVRTSAAAMAAALDGMASAMRTRERARVRQAILTSRSAYARLKQVCRPG